MSTYFSIKSVYNFLLNVMQFGRGQCAEVLMRICS